MPVLKQSFSVDHPREQVWETFQDLPLVVQCIPGASLEAPPQDGVAKGRMTVKLGPVKADFGGEAEITSDIDTYTGTIVGKGMDKSHASRAKGEVVYRLEDSGHGETVVHVDVDYTLSGSLAQFARGGIVEAVADQITKTFATNLERELNASAGATGVGERSETHQSERPAPKSTDKNRELNLFSLIIAILRSKFSGLGRR